MIRIPYLSHWVEMRRLAWEIAGRMIADHGGEEAYLRARQLKRDCLRSADAETREMGRMWDRVRQAVAKRTKRDKLDTATRYVNGPPPW